MNGIASRLVLLHMELKDIEFTQEIRDGLYRKDDDHDVVKCMVAVIKVTMNKLYEFEILQCDKSAIWVVNVRKRGRYVIQAARFDNVYRLMDWVRLFNHVLEGGSLR